jgi:hypothetical protein
MKRLEQNRHHPNGESDNSSVYERVLMIIFHPLVCWELTMWRFKKCKIFENKHTKGTKHTKRDLLHSASPCFASP